jgi:glyoxylase-like metal-dependent hydrolase (beta-lactamase superfamily II)
MKVTDSVYAFSSTRGHYAYLVMAGENVLIDTGMPRDAAGILSELRALGVAPSSIRHILLTHYDIDHIGSAARLSRETGAPVWVSPLDYPYMIGKQKRPGMKHVFSWMMRAEVPADIRPIAEGQTFGGVVPVPAPGHSPGHTCYLFGDVLFAGDLIFTRSGSIAPSPRMMTWDSAMLMSSIAAVRAHPFRIICPAHGEPVQRGPGFESL